MKQISLASTGFELVTKRTRKREFLDEMNLVVPWAELVGLIQPHAPAGKTGRPRFAVLTMLRIHFMQQWFGLSDPAMEEALHDVPLYREFAGLDAGATRMPDESTILRFRHLLEEHDLSLLLRQSPTDRAVEAGQGQHPGQGGASVSGDQAPVRFHEGALPGLGQEHGATGHAVCAEQFVDGLLGSRMHRHCGCSSMVERQLPKLHTRVRFPSPAPITVPRPANVIA